MADNNSEIIQENDLLIAGYIRQNITITCQNVDQSFMEKLIKLFVLNGNAFYPINESNARVFLYGHQSVLFDKQHKNSGGYQTNWLKRRRNC